MNSDEVLYRMGTEASVMRLAGKMMAHYFRWRHEQISGGNFTRASLARRKARRKLASLAKQYVELRRAERDAECMAAVYES